MKVLNYNLKIDVEPINRAVRDMFQEKGFQVDDIVWNPHRGALVNERFSVHSFRVTVGDWQKTVYRIKTSDITGFSTDDAQPSLITRAIEGLVAKYQYYLENTDMAQGF